MWWWCVAVRGVWCGTVSNGTVGGNFAIDRDLEFFNNVTVSHNKAHSSFAETITFTGEVDACLHVDHTMRVLTHQVMLCLACDAVTQ